MEKLRIMASEVLYCIMSHSYSRVCQSVMVITSVCVWPWVCARLKASMSLRGGEDTSCVRLGTGSGRKTEENVFLQRDCIQSLKTVIWDMNSLHGLSSLTGPTVMQQRRLVSHGALSKTLWQCHPPTPVTPHPPMIAVNSHGPYLRCHKVWLLQVGRRGGFAPSSSESVRWTLSFTAVVRGSVKAPSMTCPFTGILVPSHSVSQTRGKVFKLGLKNKEIKNTPAYYAEQLRLVEFGTL